MEIQNHYKLQLNKIVAHLAENEKKVIEEQSRLQSLYEKKQLKQIVDNNSENILKIKQLVSEVNFDEYLPKLYEIKTKLKLIQDNNKSLDLENLVKYSDEVISYALDLKEYYQPRPGSLPGYLQEIPNVDNFVKILEKYDIGDESRKGISNKVPRLNKHTQTLYEKEIERKRQYIEKMLPLGKNRNISLFAKYEGGNSEIEKKQNELINFYYKILKSSSKNEGENKQEIDKQNISPNIIFYPNTKVVNNLNSEQTEELNAMLGKYKRYYYEKFKEDYPNSGDVPTLKQITWLDNNIRYGIYKSENGEYLGYLSENDLDKPIELLRRRREGLQKCSEEREDSFYKKALVEEKNAIPDELLFKKNLNDGEKKEILDIASNSVRWGPKDFLEEPQCDVINEKLLKDIYKLNDKNIENLKFNEKQYIFGFTEMVEEYDKCPKYFRTKNMMASPEGISSCSPYVDWQPILNKMYTYFSSITKLNFPICFMLKDGEIPYKKGKTENIREVFKNDLIGVISFKFIDDRNIKIKHPTENLDIFVFYHNEKYANWLHKDFTIFKIFDISIKNIWEGLIFPNKNITYDEFNIFLFYLNMKVWQYDKNTLFLTKKSDDYIKNIIEKTGIQLKKIYYVETYSKKGVKKITETNKYIPPHIRGFQHSVKKGGKSKNALNLYLEKKFLLFDKNIVNTDIYTEKINIYNFYWDNIFKKDIVSALLYSFNVYGYNFIISNNIHFITKYKIKKGKYEKSFGIKYLLSEKYENYSIVKYKPFSINFFYSWEIVFRFKLLKENKTFNVLEISSHPSFLEACFYYENKYKKNISNYNLIYPVKYQYSNKNINNKEYIDGYTSLFKKHTNVDIYENYFDSEFVFNGNNKKYDIISSNLSTNFNKNISYLTFENQNIHLFFSLFCHAVNHLELNGSFSLTVNNVTTKAVADILIIGKKYFEEVIPYQLKIYNKLKTFGTTVVFKNFRGIPKEDNDNLKKIFEKLLKYDETMEEKYINSMKNASTQISKNKYLKLIKPPLNKNFDYKYINGFLDLPSDSPEYKFIYDFNTRVYLDKIAFIQKVIHLKESPPGIQEELKKEYKEQQLIESILWAKEFDLDTWIPDNKKTDKDFSKMILTDMFSHSKLIVERLYRPEDVDIQTIPIPDDFERIKKKLAISALNIDTRDIDVWNSVKEEVRFYKPGFKDNKNLGKKLNLTKIVSEITNLHTISQAWLKMYEITTLFDLFDKNKETLKTYHICEAPGNFISAIDYYVKTHTNIKNFDWNAQSLNFKTALIKDTYGFVKKYPNRWDFAPDESGDITKIQNIKYYGDKYCKDVSLITSDCGLAFSFNKPDDHFLKLYYSQSLFILLNLPKGGNFVAKYIMPVVSNIEISVIYLFYEHFDEVIFYKPLQNYYSREFYIIGKGYNPITEDMKLKLTEFHENFSTEIPFILDFPKNFIYQLVDVFEKLADNWIFHIDRQLYYSDNFNNLDEEDIILIRKYIDNRNKEWVKRFNLLPLNK